MKSMVSIERIENDLQNLRQFGKTEQNGVTRLPFTAEDKAARAYLLQAMQAAGLQVHLDSASNVVGHLQGLQPELPVLLIGSHYDTVINGGAYDGILGVVCGLEAVRALRDAGIQPQRSLQLIAFNDEEGVRFKRGFSGSLALVGQLSEAELYSGKDMNGISQAELMLQQGFVPQQIASAQRQAEEIFAYLELHIEQGPVLDQIGLDIGVVTAIVGTTRYFVEISGQADHAGTTPMTMRKDALAAAAAVIAKVPGYAGLADPNGVATVGYLKVEPCAVNVVPAKVTFSLDIRSQNVEAKAVVAARILQEVEQVCGDQLQHQVTLSMAEEPVAMDAHLQDVIEQAARQNGYTVQRMVSGAGHDAQIVARICPVAMIFVPSQGGRSHCAVEYTSPEAIAKGAQVLLDSVIQLTKEA